MVTLTQYLQNTVYILQMHMIQDYKYSHLCFPI